MRQPLIPLRLRFALCVMLGVYPVLTGVSYALGPFTLDWPLPLRTAAMAPVMVMLIIYGVIPTVHRLAGAWIQAGAPVANS
jgi:antibiotic biosynthesis monooxygenase (ABM) superfamily enzyme